jgi:hypothetical protein
LPRQNLSLLSFTTSERCTMRFEKRECAVYSSTVRRGLVAVSWNVRDGSWKLSCKGFHSEFAVIFRTLVTAWWRSGASYVHERSRRFTGRDKYVSPAPRATEPFFVNGACHHGTFYAESCHFLHAVPRAACQNLERSRIHVGACGCSNAIYSVP